MNKNAPLNLQQQQDILNLSQEIIDNLDESALYELTSGNLSDVDKLLETILSETYDTVVARNTPIHAGSFGYLDKLSASVEDTMRVSNFNYFILSTMPDFELNTHHIEWGNMTQLFNLLCVIAARSSGKSFFFSKAYPLWRMYCYSKAHPNKVRALAKQGMIITSEINLAMHLLSIIKEEIEENEILRERLYPQVNKDGWAKEKIVCKNGAQLIIKSYGSKMRGFHPGYIIVDDFLTDQVMYSKTQRDKYINMFHSVVMNMLEPGGQSVIVGTPFHAQDLYADLKTKGSWRVFEYPAVFPDGELLWENRFSFKALMDKRNTQGAIIFSREVLCRPVSSESSIFPWSILERSFLGMDQYTLVNNIYSHPMKFVRVVTGCDFAISANVAADFSVFYTLGIDDKDNYWLLNVYKAKGASYNEQIAHLKRINANFSPEVMGLESNQMQIIFTQGAKEAGLPVEPHHTGVGKHDLVSGLPGLAILFEQGKIKLPRGNQESRNATDELCMVLSNMAWTDKGIECAGEHDDDAMALYVAVTMARKHTSFRFSFI